MSFPSVIVGIVYLQKCLLLLAHPTRFERVTFAFGELKTSELQRVFNVRTFRKHGNKAGNLARYADKARTSGEGLRSAA
jgi:hypothetical protein